MNFLKLNANQYVELVPKGNASIIEYLTEAIAFVNENELQGVYLIVQGFTMGIYPEDYKGSESEFTQGLQQEFEHYQQTNQLKTLNLKPETSSLWLNV